MLRVGERMTALGSHLKQLRDRMRWSRQGERLLLQLSLGVEGDGGERHSGSPAAIRHELSLVDESGLSVVDAFHDDVAVLLECELHPRVDDDRTPPGGIVGDAHYIPFLLCTM